MSKEAMKLELDNLISEFSMENSSFAKRVDDIFKEAQAEQTAHPQEPLTDIYLSFEQWKSGNVLEHDVPRTEYYGEAQLDLVEMGWKYGYDAGRAVEQALDMEAENARKLELDYEPAQPQQEPLSLSGWEWMTHPSRNEGQPIPVQIFEEGGVTYYRPFDTDSTEFEWSVKGKDWRVITQQSTAPHEPIGRAHLCDRCSTPFDGEDECPECGHGSSTKKAVYKAPQPAQRKPLPEKSLHLLAAKHSFQLFDGEDFKNLMEFGRDIEAAHGIKGDA